MVVEFKGDAVTPSAKQSKALFKHGFSTWSRHLHCASRASKQGAQSFLSMIDYAFPDHPTLPSCLKLTKSSASWLATGVSTWGTSAMELTSKATLCPDLAIHPPQQRNFVVTKAKPTKVTLRKDLDISYAAWPAAGPQDDHIAVLILAWAYILSARWTEIIPGANPIRYPEIQQKTNQQSQSTISIPIETTSDEAGRRWKAVLTTGQGWLATATNSDGSTLNSPWSARLSSSQILCPVLFGHEDFPTTGTAADFTTAFQYLADYCTIHHFKVQSSAALSTVLFLPLAHHNCVDIPSPRPSTTGVRSVRPGPHEYAETLQVCPSLTQVDRLMALSCNTRGLEALLLSTFFDPDVPCNVVSPFLQGTFAILDAIAHDRTLLVCTLMHRTPKLGFLWAGALISGAHEALLEKARYGSIDVDLLVAAWTGTIHTFMQLPVSTAASGRFRRDDEGRLAYLACKDYQSSIPLAP